MDVSNNSIDDDKMNGKYMAYIKPAIRAGILPINRIPIRMINKLLSKSRNIPNSRATVKSLAGAIKNIAARTVGYSGPLKYISSLASVRVWGL